MPRDSRGRVRPAGASQGRGAAPGAEKAKARPGSAEPVQAPVAPEALAAAAKGAAVAARESGHGLAEFMAKNAVGGLFYRDDSYQVSVIRTHFTAEILSAG